MTDAQPMPDGVYFDLDEDAYHALPRLSSTAIKKLRTAPMAYWLSSQFNPLREKIDALLDKSSKNKAEGKDWGNLAHCLILEPDCLGKRFRTDVMSKTEWRKVNEQGGFLCASSVDDMKSIAKEQELDTKGSSKWKSTDWENFLREQMGQKVAFFSDYQAELENDSRIVLSAEQSISLKILEQILKTYPATRDWAKGGKTEVSILWQHEGLPFKARIDLVHPGRAMLGDAKTFSVYNGAGLSEGFDKTVRQFKYHLQAYLYLMAYGAARHLIASHLKGEQQTVFGHVSEDFLVQWAQTEITRFEWLGIPNHLYQPILIDIDLARDREYMIDAQMCLDTALSAYRFFPKDGTPWVKEPKVRPISEMPEWMNRIPEEDDELFLTEKAA